MGTGSEKIQHATLLLRRYLRGDEDEVKRGRGQSAACGSGICFDVLVCDVKKGTETVRHQMCQEGEEHTWTKDLRH